MRDGAAEVLCLGGRRVRTATWFFDLPIDTYENACSEEIRSRIMSQWGLCAVRGSRLKPQVVQTIPRHGRQWNIFGGLTGVAVTDAAVADAVLDS